jgi:hypothetical protein
MKARVDISLDRIRTTVKKWIVKAIQEGEVIELLWTGENSFSPPTR